MIFIQITDIFRYLVVRVRTFASFKKFTQYFACADLQGVGQNPSLKKSTFIKFKEWKKHRAPLPRPNTIIPEIKIWIRASCFAQPSIVIARPLKKNVLLRIRMTQRHWIKRVTSTKSKYGGRKDLFIIHNVFRSVIYYKTYNKFGSPQSRALIMFITDCLRKYVRLVKFIDSSASPNINAQPRI